MHWILVKSKGKEETTYLKIMPFLCNYFPAIFKTFEIIRLKTLTHTPAEYITSLVKIH